MYVHVMRRAIQHVNNIIPRHTLRHVIIQGHIILPWCYSVPFQKSCNIMCILTYHGYVMIISPRSPEHVKVDRAIISLSLSLSLLLVPRLFTTICLLENPITSNRESGTVGWDNKTPSCCEPATSLMFQNRAENAATKTVVPDSDVCTVVAA